MFKPVIFPYAVALREGGKIDVFPAAEIGFTAKNKKESYSFILIVDSGATVSALPQSDAESLGVVAEDGIRMSVKGIGDETISGWRHNLAIRLNGIKFRIPVVFLDKDSVPRVLGREGVFDNFMVMFDEQKHLSAFVPAKAKEAGLMRKILRGK